MMLLPILLQGALVLFLIGVVLFLWPLPVASQYRCRSARDSSCRFAARLHSHYDNPPNLHVRLLIPVSASMGRLRRHPGI